MLEVVDGVLVFSPERAEEAWALGDVARVAFGEIAYEDFGRPPSPAARAVRADAYASGRRMLAEAIAYVQREDREARGRGPLRLVYAGTIGDFGVSEHTPIGRPAVLHERITIGRSVDCDLLLRQGGHSDQNTTARRHARVERAAGGGVVVTDLRSTNGTWIRGVAIAEPTSIEPGEEITIALGHRLRLEGAP